jgi:hypothetical protein
LLSRLCRPHKRNRKRKLRVTPRSTTSRRNTYQFPSNRKRFKSRPKEFKSKKFQSKQRRKKRR